MNSENVYTEDSLEELLDGEIEMPSPPEATADGSALAQEDIDSLQEWASSAKDHDVRIVDLTEGDTLLSLGDDIDGFDPDVDSTFAFQVEYKTPQKHRKYSGMVLRGTFVGHQPTFQDNLQMGQMRAALRGGNMPHSIDPEMEKLIEENVTLHVLLDKTPEWYKPETMHLPQLVEKVYEEVVRCLNRFQGQD